MKRNQNLKIRKIIRLSILQKIRKHILKRTLLAYQSITSLWYHISRNTTSLNWKGNQDRKKMKEGWLTPWVAPQEKLELFGCEYPLFFKGRGSRLLVKGNLEMNGASALVLHRASMASTRSHELDCLWAMENGMGPAQLFYRGRLQSHWSLLWRQSIAPKWWLFWALRSDGIHSTMFDVLETSPSIFPTPPFGMGIAILCPPSIVFR